MCLDKPDTLKGIRYKPDDFRATEPSLSTRIALLTCLVYQDTPLSKIMWVGSKDPESVLFDFENWVPTREHELRWIIRRHNECVPVHEPTSFNMSTPRDQDSHIAALDAQPWAINLVCQCFPHPCTETPVWTYASSAPPALPAQQSV